MSIEMHVLFRGKLPSKTALARTMKELGFPLTIAADVGSLETHRGYMPMRLRGKATGVEFDTFNDRADVEDMAGEYFDPRFERSANFRWGGDEMEMLAGMCGAAALAKLVKGVVIDDEVGRRLTPAQAIASAERYLQSSLRRAEIPSHTRPADLKRYLKPLLERRSDLVLVGQMLLVRPVRHLLRGALIEADGKYRFDVYPYIDPLYCRRRPHGYYGDSIHGAAWNTWRPHFRPLLIDCLRDDVFDRLGKITTLEEFAAQPFCMDLHREARLVSLFLIGGRKRAADYVRQIERDDSLDEFDKQDIEALWKSLRKAPEAACAEFHAREEQAVRELKLEQIWEPSPFPVELPTARRAQAAEPLFPVDPWIPRPQSLLAEAPERPGEIRYAKDWFRRDGRVILAAPLTPETAKERHRAHEQYTLLVRLPDGCVFMINRNRGDRNEPAQFTFKPKPQEDLRAELHGPSHFAVADFSRTGTAIFELRSLRVHERLTHQSAWGINLDLKAGRKSIHSGDDDTKARLTSAERALAKGAALPFGEYALLADRIRSLLRVAGYGRLA